MNARVRLRMIILGDPVFPGVQVSTDQAEVKQVNKDGVREDLSRVDRLKSTRLEWFKCTLNESWVDLWYRSSDLKEQWIETWGAFHYAKISGNFGRNINVTLRSRWKFSGKSGPPPEVVLFDRSVPSDQNLPCHFQKFSFSVPLHWEVIEISVETKWDASVRFEILFLSNNVVPFSPG